MQADDAVREAIDLLKREGVGMSYKAGEDIAELIEQLQAEGAAMRKAATSVCVEFAGVQNVGRLYEHRELWKRLDNLCGVMQDITASASLLSRLQRAEAVAEAAVRRKEIGERNAAMNLDFDKDFDEIAGLVDEMTKLNLDFDAKVAAYRKGGEA